ncbi:UDP-2,4-diacetamido-2,4,6-trideoxy-beta-L-altropyranose hydrolase [Sulfuricurvum sp.]|uniref:UDP-2,4-diacetamido-2,4, 6-trideoxy-beta-L-altropyranose hydrolase n=1 Tax=Sulfuricurvum sp. TaxID=2025608 RepID=UPI002E31BDEA|nr:UDP-2,4-diacetamido-2,4,6-trideoxy-beta-L-altropyranose hydrolase [Sulfuricurvum sp.]HEX5330382.1 UDP-2,4-diacetamido-2,4,6-trideoxy-beta-L-altropyranose hydrolase [Sulfuricurvum sp.]
MNLLIRADSSSAIGLGHIMRDVVFAAQHPQDTVRFACQNLSGNIIDQIPYPVDLLTSNDPDELIALIREQNIDRVVFDHYGIDAVFEKKIKDACGVTVLSFDDTYEAHYCDILLNHNISADSTRYRGLVPEQCELCCGAEYTLIRDEFKTEKQIDREKLYDIFIAMGGTDPTNATMTILATLNDDVRVCVVTTSGNAHVNELITFVQTKKNITLEVDSARIAQLLHQSSLAIITPSVMVHEVLFMEIPFIAVQTVANQEDMFVYLEKEGYTVLKEWDASAIARFYNT